MIIMTDAHKYNYINFVSQITNIFQTNLYIEYVQEIEIHTTL